MLQLNMLVCDRSMNFEQRYLRQMETVLILQVVRVDLETGQLTSVGPL